MTADQVTAVMDRCVQPVLEHNVDNEHGGFLADLDERFRPSGAQRKSLEHAARTTMALGLLHAARPDGGYAASLRHGLEFLTGPMWDHEHGGFFALVERDGSPAWRGLKHPHAVTYAARAFALGVDVLPPGVGLDWMRRSLSWLDEVAWDPVSAAYRGTYRRDNSPYQPGDVLPTGHGRDPLGDPLGYVESNTTSDALGMFVELAGAGYEPLSRLEVFVERIVAVVQPPGILPYLYRPDWTPAPAPARLGHQFQTVRRLVEAGDLLGGARCTESTARTLADFAFRSCRWDEGFPNEISPRGPMPSPTRARADDREWWIQLEALDAASVLMSRVEDDDERALCTRVRDVVWSVFVDRYVDWRHGGTFRVPRPPTQRAGQDTQTSKSGVWKDISHEVAVLLHLARTLR